MSDTPLKDLDPRVRKQVEKAVGFLRQGNPSQAIDICSGLLVKFPGAVEIRKVLREAQRNASAGKKKSFLSGISLFKAQKMMRKKDPAEAIIAAERELNSNPANVDALASIADAAIELNLPHTAVHARECIRDINSGDVENLKKLAAAYLEAKDIAAAIQTADKALGLAPGDGEAQELVKKASVMQSLDQGKWEEEGDFRSKLKDADEAVRLEQLNRSRTDEKGLADLIAESVAAIEEQPENVNLYKKLAGYYEQGGEFDKAVATIQDALKTELGGNDSSLEKLIQRYRTAGLKQKIASAEESLQSNPEDSETAATLQILRAELAEFELESALETVEKYPNDYTARFHLGVLLLDADRIDESIQHLQIAQRNPKVRLQAIISLGRAYAAKNFFDLAAEQFRTAKKEILVMNQQKKEAIYELGCALEAQGKTDEAIAEFKEVYAADISFRDVAAKIDAFYANS